MHLDLDVKFFGNGQRDSSGDRRGQSLLEVIVVVDEFMLAEVEKIMTTTK